MSRVLQCSLMILVAFTPVNASEYLDVEPVSIDNSYIPRGVVSSSASYRSEARYHHHRTITPSDYPSRHPRPEVQTLTTPVILVINQNNTATHRNTAGKTRPQQRSSQSTPAYRLPDDIQGLYKASQGSDKGRAKAAFEELKKRAKDSITAMDFVSKCYFNGYGCLISEHWSNHWQDKYTKAKRRR